MRQLADGTIRALARIILGDGFSPPLPLRTHKEIDEFASRCGLGKSRPAASVNRLDKARWYLDYANEATSGEKFDHFLNEALVVNPLYEAFGGEQSKLVPPKLDAVILRLCDPREYSGTEFQVGDVVNEVNRALGPEGLEVRLNATTPVLRSCKPSLPAPIRKRPEKSLEPPPDFSVITADDSLEPYLRERWLEAQVCWHAKACLASVVMMGSILEGVLLAFASSRAVEANSAEKAPKDKNGRPRSLSDWGLANLIEVGHELGWLQGDVRRYAHSLKESRNIVHPAMQRILKERPDDDTCRMSWEVLKAALNDLRRFSGGTV